MKLVFGNNFFQSFQVGMLRHAQSEFSSIIRGEVRLLWVGCKNLVEETLMGRDLVIF